MRSKFCLSSTASFEKINRAQTNRSTTKKTYSFSKTNRFEELRSVYILPHLDVLLRPTAAISRPENLQLVSGTGLGRISPNA